MAVNRNDPCPCGSGKKYKDCCLREKMLLADLWTLRAEKGDAEAQFKLAQCYQKGDGVEQSFAKAIEWYTKAAEQGNTPAQCNLANFYYFGIGVKKSYKKAVLWYKKAATQGNDLAQYKLAECYWYGRGIEESYEKAVEWYTKAAEAGNAEAQVQLGIRYYLGSGVEQSYELAVFWYTKAADAGNAEAQTCLGTCYFDGKGVQQSYQKAVALFEKAESKGNSEALRLLGYCYEKGIGVEQSFKKAIDFYSKAVEKGNTRAQVSLGKSYYLGLGVEQSYQQAVALFEKAVEQDDPVALTNLGICYYYGKGVERDYDLARELFQQAADQNYGGALVILLNTYLYGLGGVEKSFETAMSYRKSGIQAERDITSDLSDEFLKKELSAAFDNPLSDEEADVLVDTMDKTQIPSILASAQLGDPFSQYVIGSMYLEGIGLEESVEKGLFYLKEAATGGVLIAQLFLAYSYLDGAYVEESFEESGKWFKMAAEQGHADAQYFLGMWYYELEKDEHWAEKAVEWYTKAAQQGHAEAQSSLAECFEKGEGVAQSDEKAYYWYKKAYENGEETAKSALDRLERKNRSLRWAAQRDAFISWNHENKDLRLHIEGLLKEKGISIWQSDENCTGEITEACLNAIHASRSWIILVTEESLKSTWVAAEIEEVFRTIENDPELKICVIPVYKNREVYLLTQKLCEENPDTPFKKIVDLGGIYGIDLSTDVVLNEKRESAADDDRIGLLVKGALNMRKIIEYRTRSREQNADFNTFTASRAKQDELLDEMCFKYLMEEGYLPRMLLSHEGGELKEPDFIKCIADHRTTLLYAEGGAGKTLFLQNLVHNYFKGELYIFTVTAKKLAEYLRENDSQQALLDYFIQDMNAAVGYGYNPDLSAIYTLMKLEPNKVVFIIDALDELGGDRTALDHILDVTVRSHLKEEKNVRFLFTSRNASDSAEVGADEVYTLRKFSREDGKRMAKLLFDRFAEKIKKREENALLSIDLSENSLYVELDKLRDDIAGNPLLVTNFVILYFYHLSRGGALPKNEFEITKESIAFIVEDLEQKRDVSCRVDKTVLAGLSGILCNLAYRRAQGDNNDTVVIFKDYICKNILKGDDAASMREAKELLNHLRSRAIIVGQDNAGNVCHAIFRSYLAAQALYNDCYESKQGKIKDSIVFTTIEEDGEVFSGKDILAHKKKTLFVNRPITWSDTEAFLVAGLDKNIFDLPGVDEDEPLDHNSRSYATLKDTLDLLYGKPEDKKRDAYLLLMKMLQAESLYNIDAIKTILKV